MKHIKKIKNYLFHSKIGATVAFILYIVIVAGLTYGVHAFVAKSSSTQKPTTLGPYTIILKQNGFEPSSVTIRKGETLTFTTTNGKEFWPASDVHPTHTIYPEFDPKRPIEPGSTWSFQFDKVGTWTFHDHLSPLFHGTVTVINASGQAAHAALQYKNPDECHALSDNAEKMICWQQTIQNAIDIKGIKAGFDVYTQFYNTEPSFAQNCHGYTHNIGQAAYKKYSHNEDFDVTPQVAYCSYGFFHGFIEAMFQDTGSLDKARDFCVYIDKRLEGQTSVFSACMHGIGHGVTDGTDTRAWGDVNALIEPGKKLCEKVASDDYEKTVCGSGIFNSLEGLYMDPKYKITIDKNDPFYVCRQQDKDYFKKACFDDFKDIIMVISHNDFAKAAKFVEGIKEDYFAVGAIDNLATYNAYFILRKPNYDYAIDICHHLQPRLHVGCIAGLGAGFMTAGTPDKEYIKALELCQSPRITADERAGCFKRVLHATYLRYSPAMHKQICDSVNEKDKKNISECK